MQKQFKVGQVWRQRSGGVDVIESIDSDPVYPINGFSGASYTVDGLQFAQEESSDDLKECLLDRLPLLPKFDRDQMAWEIYRDWQAMPDMAYGYVDKFLAEMAKQHEAKQ